MSDDAKSPDEKKTSRKPINWEAVEVDYRVGLLTLREMAEAHGVSHVMIAKKAKALGWTRDLSAKIKAKADDLVNRAAVTSSVTKVTEAEIIEKNGTQSATVQITQRTDIKRARDLNMVLLAEIEMQADPPSERTKTMKAWTESFRALIAMEREAYGIQATEQTKDLTVRLLPSDAGLL